MRVRPKHSVSFAIFLTTFFGLASGRAPAGVWDEIAIGLGSAGFDLRGDHNVLSGGTDLLITNTFQGETFDFGALELTLSGPLSLDLSTGGRWVHNVDIALTTAASSNAAARPLTYELTYDPGGQQTSIAGTLLIDGSVSVNRFGWYELEVDYSSRQTIVNEGRFDNGTREVDFDVGPINVRGNIFADMLAAVTDPFFDAANLPNVFASFSGREQFKQVLSGRLQEAVAVLHSNALASSEASDAARARAVFAEVFGPAGETTSEDGVATAGRSSQQVIYASVDPSPDAASSPRFGEERLNPVAATGIVPEPSVLLLMLLGIPAILTRRRRPSVRPSR